MASGTGCAPGAVALFRFQPEAKPGIVDLRFVVPETRTQAALDEKVVEPELDLGNALGKIAAHVASANIEAQ